MERRITCINCPLGCEMTVSIEDGRVTSISGNECGRGPGYARNEVTNPTRVLTTTVAIHGAEVGVAPVKTALAIPKELLHAAAAALKNVRVEAPIHAGDVIVAGICGTGVDVVATRSLRRTGPEDVCTPIPELSSTTIPLSKSHS